MQELRHPVVVIGARRFALESEHGYNGLVILAPEDRLSDHTLKLARRHFAAICRAELYFDRDAVLRRFDIIDAPRRCVPDEHVQRVPHSPRLYVGPLLALAPDLDPNLLFLRRLDTRF